MALENHGRNSSLNYLLDVEDEPEEPAGRSGFVFVSFSGVDLEIFVGLYVCPGYALVDTGAQHGVIGRAAYDQFVQRLAVQGLKPRIIPTLQVNATGVGGATRFELSAECPIALAQVCGILTFHVVPNNIPPLLPVDF